MKKYLVRFLSLILAGSFLILAVPAVAQSEDQPLRERVGVLLEKKYTKKNAIEANGLLPVAREKGNPELTFDLLDWLVEYHTRAGEYEKAMFLCGEALAEARRSGDDMRIADGEMNVGIVHYRTGNYKQSITTVQPLSDTYKALGDTLKSGTAEAWIAVNYVATGSLDTALRQLLLARTTLRQHGTSADWLEMDYNLGAVYAMMGMSEKGLTFIRQYVSTVLAERDSSKFAPAYGNLAYNFQQLGDFSSALIYYDSSLYYSRMQEQDIVTYVTLKDMSDGYKAVGDYKNALKYFQEYETIKDSVLGENTLNRIAELEVMYETEQRESALEASEERVLLLEREARLRNQRLVLIVIGLLSSLLVAVLIFRQWRKDIRYRETQKKLIASELANERLTSRLLSSQLENKQGDLTDFALDIERKNKFFRELTGRLDAIRALLPASFRTQLDSIIRFAQGHDQLNENLEVVQENVDQVNYEFHHKLKDSFPNLTSSDQALAGLLRLNMTNKEVAMNRGISTASAKMARYRLRKKLNLTPADDIISFLRDI